MNALYVSRIIDATRRGGGGRWSMSIALRTVSWCRPSRVAIVPTFQCSA